MEIFIITKTKIEKQEDGFAISSIFLATVDKLKAITTVSDKNRADPKHIYMLSCKDVE